MFSWNGESIKSNCFMQDVSWVGDVWSVIVYRKDIGHGTCGHAGDKDAKIRQTNSIWNSLSTENTS